MDLALCGPGWSLRRVSAGEASRPYPQNICSPRDMDERGSLLARTEDVWLPGCRELPGVCGAQHAACLLVHPPADPPASLTESQLCCDRWGFVCRSSCLVGLIACFLDESQCNKDGKRDQRDAFAKPQRMMFRKGKNETWRHKRIL